MNKELKALNTIIDALQHVLRGEDVYPTKEELGDAITILRDAIDEYQYMKNARYVLLGGRMGNKSARYDILAKLKVLKVIIKKQVDVRFFLTCSSLKKYNYIFKGTTESHLQLTRQEWDLLKEELYDENTLVRSLALCNNKIQKGKKV